MQHIHLTDDSFVLSTSTGMRTVNRTSFNFNKIRKMVKEGATEAEIAPLLVTPSLPDGLYEAHLDAKDDTLWVKHLAENGNINWTVLNGPQTIKHGFGHLQFLGVYASQADLMADWPEYCL